MTVKEHHDRAMDLTFWADAERHHNPALRQSLYRLALQEELTAITLLGSRSEQLADQILHRSAAWLALNAGQPQLAYELAARPFAANESEELQDVRAVARQALENPTQPIPERGYYPEIPAALPTENPLPELKRKRYAPKTYSRQAEAQEELEALQMRQGFENAFLLGSWNAAGQPEWLLGIYAPRLGRMLLIDEDQLESGRINYYNPPLFPAT